MFRAAKWPDGRTGTKWRNLIAFHSSVSLYWLNLMTGILCELQTRPGPCSDNNGWSSGDEETEAESLIWCQGRKGQQSSQYRGGSKFTDQLKYAGYWLVWVSRGRWPIRGASDEVRWPGEDDSSRLRPSVVTGRGFLFSPDPGSQGGVSRVSPVATNQH